jgi:hypothetical protein
VSDGAADSTSEGESGVELKPAERSGSGGFHLRRGHYAIRESYSALSTKMKRKDKSGETGWKVEAIEAFAEFGMERK